MCFLCVCFGGCLSWLVVVCLGVAGFWCTCIQYRQCPNCFVHIGSIGNTCTYNRQYRQHGQYKQYTQHRQFRVYRQYIYTYTHISNVFIYTYISKANQSVIYALPAARPSGPPPAVRPPAPGRPAGVLRPPGWPGHLGHGRLREGADPNRTVRARTCPNCFVGVSGGSM